MPLNATSGGVGGSGMVGGGAGRPMFGGVGGSGMLGGGVGDVTLRGGRGRGMFGGGAGGGSLNDARLRLGVIVLCSFCCASVRCLSVST